MAKNNKKTSNISFLSDIIKGNFIFKDEFKKYIGVILLVLLFFFITIYNNHLASKKSTELNKLKEQVEENKSRNAFAQSKLIKMKMESQLGKEMIADSLLSLETHPHKLLIKINKKNVSTK